MGSIEGKRFLTISETWDFFDRKISKTTLTVLVREGKIPSIHLGRRVLIPASYLQSQLDVGKVAE